MHRNCTATLAALRVAGLCQSPFLLPNWVPSNRTGPVAGMQELFDTVAMFAGPFSGKALTMESLLRRPQPSADSGFRV